MGGNVARFLETTQVAVPLRGTGKAPRATFLFTLKCPIRFWLLPLGFRLTGRLSRPSARAGVFALEDAFSGRVWYTLTEHAVTLIGVRPDAVLTNDPALGQAWHSKAHFESAFHTFEERAVVLD
jgi:hypothetical protein